MSTRKQSDRRPYLFDRLTNPQELDHAWAAVLAHYPKNRVPQELREFDRKRGGALQQLSAALRGRTFIPEPASLTLWGLAALGCTLSAYRRRQLV